MSEWYENDIFFLTLVSLLLWNETTVVTTNFNGISWYNADYLINTDHGVLSTTVNNVTTVI